MFVLPTIRPPCHLLVWLYLRFVFPAFVTLSVCHPPFVATIVISTSNSPYEQWLVGGLVVLCDVAVAAAAEGVELLLLAIAVSV
jgi:hypothetical protein